MKEETQVDFQDIEHLGIIAGVISCSSSSYTRLTSTNTLVCVTRVLISTMICMIIF